MSSHVVGVRGGEWGGGGGSSVISFLCSHTLREHEGPRSSHGVRFSFVVSVVECSLPSSFFASSSFVVRQPFFFRPVR